MIFSIRHKQIELVLLLVITAILSNLLTDLGLCSDKLAYYNQMLFFTIGYICLAKLLSIQHKYNGAIILGQLFFIGQCVLIYYTNNFLDCIAFIVCVSVTMGTMALKDQERCDYFGGENV